MRRLGREQRPPWPLERRRCYACHTGAVESVSHFLGECRAYAGHRRRLLNTVRRALDGGACTVRGDEFVRMDNTGQYRLQPPLPGCRVSMVCVPRHAVHISPLPGGMFPREVGSYYTIIYKSTHFPPSPSST